MPREFSIDAAKQKERVERVQRMTPESWLKRRRNIVALLLILIGLAPAYLHAYSISAGGVSEAPTILAGDTIVVNQAAYTIRLPYTSLKLLQVGAPHRGAMVLILVPPKGVPAPKRIVGLPADTVEIRDHLVVVNGQPLPLEKLDPADFRWVPDSNHVGTTIEKEDGHWITRTIGTGKYRDHGPVHLGDGQYFAIGDNRDMSLDSRAFGPITAAQIVGKVIAVIPTGHGDKGSLYAVATGSSENRPSEAADRFDEITVRT